MIQFDKDIAALRDGMRSSICRQDMETTLRNASLARILDALEEAREVIGFYADRANYDEDAAPFVLVYGTPDKTGPVAQDLDEGYKARAFLAKYGEGESNG